VAAVPVAAEDTCRDLTSFVDELVCPLRPVNFMAVGEWYEDFGQTTDQEVRDLMSLHAN
jgi:predicted phosphoribosyltransferase